MPECTPYSIKINNIAYSNGDQIQILFCISFHCVDYNKILFGEKYVSLDTPISHDIFTEEDIRNYFERAKPDYKIIEGSITI
jgi:hypothetical protein